MSESLPVIIAGSGPAGSALALYLAQNNIPVLLLEKFPTLPVDLRASTFHPPSLEMLDGLGIVDKMIDKGLKVSKYQYRDRRTNEVAEFDMSIIKDETKFPFRLQLEQYEMTFIVRDELKKYPHAQHEFGWEVVDFKQDGDEVEVVINTPLEYKRIRTPFLIGADGANSNVRKAAGIEYQGFSYAEKFLVASTPFPFEDVFDNLDYVNYVSDPDEWCVILRTDKLWRVLFPTDPECPNPHEKYHTKMPANHFEPGIYSLGNALGILGFREDRKYVQLSDGGHFENTGVYELIRRRAKLIIVCDGGADPDTSFSDFQTTVRRVEDDFGARIEVDDEQSPDKVVPTAQKKATYPKNKKFAKQGFMRGKITYADGSDGTIIYLKTTLIRNVSFKVKGYAASNPDFPDQSTADQFFDEIQFEAYRELGHAITSQMLNSPAVESDLAV